MFQCRGKVSVKGKGEMTTYFLTGRKESATVGEKGGNQQDAATLPLGGHTANIIAGGVPTPLSMMFRDSTKNQRLGNNRTGSNGDDRVTDADTQQIQPKNDLAFKIALPGLTEDNPTAGKVVLHHRPPPVAAKPTRNGRQRSTDERGKNSNSRVPRRRSSCEKSDGDDTRAKVNAYNQTASTRTPPRSYSQSRPAKYTHTPPKEFLNKMIIPPPPPGSPFDVEVPNRRSWQGVSDHRLFEDGYSAGNSSSSDEAQTKEEAGDAVLPWVYPAPNSPDKRCRNVPNMGSYFVKAKSPSPKVVSPISEQNSLGNDSGSRKRSHQCHSSNPKLSPEDVPTKRMAVRCEDRNDEKNANRCTDDISGKGIPLDELANVNAVLAQLGERHNRSQHDKLNNNALVMRLEPLARPHAIITNNADYACTNHSLIGLRFDPIDPAPKDPPPSDSPDVSNEDDSYGSLSSSDDDSDSQSAPLLDSTGGYITDYDPTAVGENASLANETGLTDTEGALSDLNSMLNNDPGHDADMDDTTSMSASSRASSRVFDFSDRDQLLSLDSLCNAYGFGSSAAAMPYNCYDSEYDNYRPGMISDDDMFHPDNDIDLDGLDESSVDQNIRTLSDNITRNFGQPQLEEIEEGEAS